MELIPIFGLFLLAMKYINVLNFSTHKGEEFFLAIVLRSNRFLGELLLPVACLPSDHQSYKVVHLLHTLELSVSGDLWPLLDKLQQLSSLLDTDALVRRFSKKATTAAQFFSVENKKQIDQVVMPFVWKQTNAIYLLCLQHQLPVFDALSWPHLYPQQLLHLAKTEAQIRLLFHKEADSTSYALQAWLDDQRILLKHQSTSVLSVSPCLIRNNGQLIRFDETVTGLMLKPFLNKDEIVIPARIERDYYEKFIRKMAGRSNIEAVGFSITDVETEPHAFLRSEKSWDGRYGLILEFGYGEKSFLFDHPQLVATSLKMTDSGVEFRRVKRNSDWEKSMAAILFQLGFAHQASFFFLQDHDKQFAFINRLMVMAPTLEAAGFLLIQPHEEAFLLHQPELKVDLKRSIDWFDLHITIHAGKHSFPFLLLRNHLLSGERVFLLPGGERFLIPEMWFEQYGPLLIHGNIHKDVLQLKHFHSVLLTEAGFTGASEEQAEQTNDLGQFAVPPLNRANLRPYQIYGFHWLTSTLSAQQGALLADDMGLGKTIQVIALIVAMLQKSPSANSGHKQKNGVRASAPDLFSALEAPPVLPELSLKATNPVLIVMPTSLLHNWKNELDRFAPQLHVVVFAGNGRKLNEAVFRAADVILTTYGIMRNDIALLSQFPFSLAVLDESQAIKNPSSKTAYAAFELKAKYRVALTGTPVENHLSDLWSQMHFLNPGLLGELSMFNRYYAVPISRNPEVSQRLTLLRMIGPFILRRTKAQVMKDLPPVSETIIFCEMTDAQRFLYEQEKSRMRLQLMDDQQLSQGISTTGMLYLTALLRMRQLANHPAILFPDGDHGSGKFDELMQHLETVLDEDHKVLIFSSFVSQLQLLADKLGHSGIDFLMLTGQTEKRGAVISNFKSGNTKVFLISLKAGGVGLNLAEADYVFILDPWWNPAAEAQAIGRSHRIGQKNSVFVYRFITRDSIEEKMMKLQQEKQQLAENTILEDSFFAALTQDEMLALIQDA